MIILHLAVIVFICQLCCLLVYSQADHPVGDDVNGGLYEVMRKELRHAVEEIRMDLEQVCSKYIVL